MRSSSSRPNVFSGGPEEHPPPFNYCLCFANESVRRYGVAFWQKIQDFNANARVLMPGWSGHNILRAVHAHYQQAASQRV